MAAGNYSAASNNMKLVHWPLMGGLLHLVQRGGDWARPQWRLSVAITVLLYGGFNERMKGLTDCMVVLMSPLEG